MKKLFYLMVLSVFGLSSTAQIVTATATTDLVLSFKSYSFIYIDGTVFPGDPVVFNLPDGFTNPGEPILKGVLTSDPLFLNYAVAPPYDDIYVSLETPAGTDLSAFEISIVSIANNPVIPSSLSTPTVGGPLVLVPNAGKSLWVSDLMWKSSGSDYTTTPPSGTNLGIEFEIRVTLNDGSPSFSSSYAALNSAMSDATLLFSFDP